MTESQTQTPAKRPFPPRSVETDLIIKHLSPLPKGSQVPIEKINELTGLTCSPGGRGYTCLNTARKVLRREDRAVWVLQRHTLQRLDDAETIASQASRRRHIQKTIRRGVEEMSTVDFSGVTPEQKLQANVALTHSAVILELLMPRAVKRLEIRVEEAGERLPVQKAIEACMSNGQTPAPRP